MTKHRIIIGSSETMNELDDESIHLVVTSPPYFNAPFDYKELFGTYNHYLDLLNKVANELFRVLAQGRIVALNIDDMLVDGEKFPKSFKNQGLHIGIELFGKNPMVI